MLICSSSGCLALKTGHWSVSDVSGVKQHSLPSGDIRCLEYYPSYSGRDLLVRHSVHLSDCGHRNAMDLDFRVDSLSNASQI